MGCGSSKVEPSQPVTATAKRERSKSIVTMESQQRTVAAYRRQRMARDLEQDLYLRAEAEVEKALMLKRSSIDERRPSYVLRALKDLQEIEEGQDEPEDTNHPMIMVDQCSEIDLKINTYEHITNNIDYHTNNSEDYPDIHKANIANEGLKQVKYHDHDQHHTDKPEDRTDKLEDSSYKPADCTDNAEDHTEMPEEHTDVPECHTDIRKDYVDALDDHTDMPAQHTEMSAHHTDTWELDHTSMRGHHTEMSADHTETYADKTDMGKDFARQHEHLANEQQITICESEYQTKRPDTSENEVYAYNEVTSQEKDTKLTESISLKGLKSEAEVMKEVIPTTDEAIKHELSIDKLVDPKLSHETNHEAGIKEMGEKEMRSGINENCINENLEQGSLNHQDVDSTKINTGNTTVEENV